MENYILAKFPHWQVISTKCVHRPYIHTPQTYARSHACTHTCTHLQYIRKFPSGGVPKQLRSASVSTEHLFLQCRSYSVLDSANMAIQISYDHKHDTCQAEILSSVAVILRHSCCILLANLVALYVVHRVWRCDGLHRCLHHRESVL